MYIHIISYQTEPKSILNMLEIRSNNACIESEILRFKKGTSETHESQVHYSKNPLGIRTCLGKKN